MLAATAAWLAAPRMTATQAIYGTCASCGDSATAPSGGRCIASGTEWLDALTPAERRLTVFETSDHHDVRALTVAHLAGGASTSASDITGRSAGSTTLAWDGVSIDAARAATAHQRRAHRADLRAGRRRP
jgi:hypothetical protein